MAYDDQRQKLAEAIARRKESERGRYQALSRHGTGERNQMYRDKAQEGWGNQAMQGAAVGSAFGPWGTLIGGIGGSVLGGLDNFKNYKKSGMGTGDALGATLSNIPGTLPSMSSAAQGAPAISGAMGQMVGGAGTTLPPSPAEQLTAETSAIGDMDYARIGKKDRFNELFDGDSGDNPFFGPNSGQY